MALRSLVQIDPVLIHRQAGNGKATILLCWNGLDEHHPTEGRRRQRAEIELITTVEGTTAQAYHQVRDRDLKFVYHRVQIRRQPRGVVAVGTLMVLLDAFNAGRDGDELFAVQHFVGDPPGHRTADVMDLNDAILRVSGDVLGDGVDVVVTHGNPLSGNGY